MKMFILQLYFDESNIQAHSWDELDLAAGLKTDRWYVFFQGELYWSKKPWLS